MAETTTKPPRWLTQSGWAVAERRRWENRLVQEIRYVMHHPPRARWSSRVTAMMADVEGLPPLARDLLLAHEPDPDDPEEALDLLGRTLATAGFNAHALATSAAHGLTHKRWVTRRDAHVRPSHAAVDGHAVPLSTPFVVDGYPLQYPADARSAPTEVWITAAAS